MGEGINRSYVKTIRFSDVSPEDLELTLYPLFSEEDDITASVAKSYVGADLELTVVSTDENKAIVRLIPFINRIKATYGDDIYGEDEDMTLEQSLVKVLGDRSMTVSTAESCTGGLVAAKIINVSGASDVYEQGVITYTDESKKELLGVDPETIARYTAVSEETAKEMAERIAEISGTRMGISVTGYAGPVGGTPKDPVGTVYIGISINGETTVHKFRFESSRNEVREQAALKALDLARRAAADY